MAFDIARLFYDAQAIVEGNNEQRMPSEPNKIEYVSAKKISDAPDSYALIYEKVNVTRLYLVPIISSHHTRFADWRIKAIRSGTNYDRYK